MLLSSLHFNGHNFEPFFYSVINSTTVTVKQRKWGTSARRLYYGEVLLSCFHLIGDALKIRPRTHKFRTTIHEELKQILKGLLKLQIQMGIILIVF